MLKKKFIRKITKKSRYSYMTVIPKEIIDRLGWRERQRIVLSVYDKNKVLITDWKK